MLFQLFKELLCLCGCLILLMIIANIIITPVEYINKKRNQKKYKKQVDRILKELEKEVSKKKEDK